MIAMNFSYLQTIPVGDLLPILEFPDWIDEVSDEFDILWAENGADREMDFNPQTSLENEYEIYKVIVEGLNTARKNYPTNLLKYYKGYIVLANCEKGILNKINKIKRGDTFGFITLKEELKTCIKI